MLCSCIYCLRAFTSFVPLLCFIVYSTLICRVYAAIMGDNSIVGVVAASSAKLCVSDSIPDTDFNTWIIDTGASDHMSYDANFFDELSSNTRDPYITSVNGLPSPITVEAQSLSLLLCSCLVHY